MDTEHNFPYEKSLSIPLSPAEQGDESISYCWTSPSAALVGELPSLEAVRAIYPHLSRGVVTFESIGVVVKYGPLHKARFEEAQALQAVKHAFLNGEVPLPDLYRWAMHKGSNYLYMSLVTGPTLKDVWLELSISEKYSMTAELKQMISHLRSVPQSLESAIRGSLFSTISFALN